MWSCTSLNIFNEKCKLPNHFVPVLPVADLKICNSCMKGQSVRQSLSPACMQAEFEDESISSWVEPPKQLKLHSPLPISPSDSKKAKTKQSDIFSFLQPKQVASTATFNTAASSSPTKSIQPSSSTKGFSIMPSLATC